MKTKTIKIYQYSELSEQAKKQARQWYLEGNVDDLQWRWEDMKDDAKRIGLDLTAWDYGRYCKGRLIDSMQTVCEAILKEHGKDCETFKTAIEYLAQYNNLSEDQDDEREEIEEEFTKSILEDYRIMLDHEADYVQSEEYVAETIEANEYEFDENGRRI